MSGVEIVEATLEESAEIAYRELQRALAELDKPEPDLDHVRMWVHSATIWVRP